MGGINETSVLPQLPCLAVVLAIAVCLAPAGQAGQTARPAAPDASAEARVREALAGVPLIDGHNDLAENLRDLYGNHLDRIDLAADTGHLDHPLHTDILRLRRGGVGGLFFAAFVPPELAGPATVSVLFEQIDVIRRVAGRYPGDLELATSAADVSRIHRAGRIAALIGIENGQAIDSSLAVLRQAHACGARYMTLTHWKNSDWADAGTDEPRHHGLTAFGREVVREMNRMGMLVDLSHVSDETALAALDTSEAPVIFSHSSARALCAHRRNVPDAILRRVPGNRGIVMVNFAPGFISEEVRAWDEPIEAEWRRLSDLHPNDPKGVWAEIQKLLAGRPKGPVATLAQIADHLDHIRQVAGIDHVGLGSDFDGISATPVGLEDVSCYPALLAELLRRGWSASYLRKVAGLNILRVMREAEQVAVRLQRQRPPSDATIGDLDAPPPAAAPAPPPAH